MGTTYKKNFLVQVIARIDFATPLPKIEVGLPSSLVAKALELFPIEEPKKFSGKEFELSIDEFKEKRVEGIDWFFHGRNREKSLCFGQQAMYIIYNTYQSFNQLKNEFLTVFEHLYKVHPEIVINRLGLRYVNNIEITDKSPMDWTDYITNDLLSIFNVAIDKDKISRAIHILEMNYSDMSFRFQYGMHNPDYPAPIRRKVFLLDYDAYYQGLITQNEIMNNLVRFHDYIEQQFESSINQGLRGVMNADHR